MASVLNSSTVAQQSGVFKMQVNMVVILEIVILATRHQLAQFRQLAQVLNTKQNVAQPQLYILKTIHVWPNVQVTLLAFQSKLASMSAVHAVGNVLELEQQQQKVIFFILKEILSKNYRRRICYVEIVSCYCLASCCCFMLFRMPFPRIGSKGSS